MCATNITLIPKGQNIMFTELRKKRKFLSSCCSMCGYGQSGYFLRYKYTGDGVEAYGFVIMARCRRG